GQIPGVSGLERRVGEALTSAVSRDEVLQNVETFTEVSRDRGLDDGAVRLRHEAAHTGKLTDLSSRTAGAGVGHHEDRVERLLLPDLTLQIGRLFRAELLHHGLR